MLKILLDMDDVLLDLLPHWVGKLNELAGEKGTDAQVATHDIRCWDISRFFPTLTKQEIFSAIGDDGFWSRIPPTKNGQWFVKKLQKLGHEVLIVTASGYETVPSKMKRFFHLYPTLSWNDVVVTSRKQRVLGDVLIDDAVHNLMGGAYEKILLSKPHNMEFDAALHGIHRIDRLENAFQILRRVKSRARG